LVAPEWYNGAGADIDAAVYMKSLAASNVSAVQMYIKDHHGIAYYDTKVGKRSSFMKGDLLADLVREARAHDIQFLAYYSVGWDNWMAECNPEWVMRSSDGEPVTAGYWTYLCYNTPYREFMLAQLHEIAQYGVDGLWLDILRYPQMGFHACFCAGCRAKFLASGEAEMPKTINFRCTTWSARTCACRARWPMCCAPVWASVAGSLTCRPTKWPALPGRRSTRWTRCVPITALSPRKASASRTPELSRR